MICADIFFIKWMRSFIAISLYLVGISTVFAAHKTIDLFVGYKKVFFIGKVAKAIAVNDQIPAPTLHFKKGDHVTINVYNQLDKGTTIHWHGILVPWQMDGVEGISQKAILPGKVFQYNFKLEQSGTYWYHAHAGLQEQQGLYGAFIIDPPVPSSYRYSKDFVVVLSDWSNTRPEKILANLKKDGDYYSPKFPLQPSLAKFIHDYRKSSMEERKKLIMDYKMMQQMRMSIYDISDVAYDAYLLNGQTKYNPWAALVKIGDVVRLRFIGSAASTIYRIKIPNTSMKMVHVQGNDVKPYNISDFTIAPGETYDVLVKIEKDDPYIIYAESLDTLGKAVGVLLTHPNQSIVNKFIPTFPEPEPTTREMMVNMMSGKEQGSMKHMGHSTMNNHSKMPMNHSMRMPIEPTIIGDKIESFPKHTMKMHEKHLMNDSMPINMNHAMSSESTTQGTKYQALKAAVKTNNPYEPDKIIKMELFGYMDRFIWFINGLPEYKTKPIHLELGKRYRIIFTNNSMMRHPMHIHGHWFILRTGNGAYDPLLHTIEVPPGATAVADVDTDASGQWFFHCHHLYHMITGMSRVFQYTTLLEIVKDEAKPEKEILQTAYRNRPIIRVDEQVPIDTKLVHHPMAHPAGFYFANYLDIGEDPFHNAQAVTFKGIYGGDYNKLELYTNDAEVKKGKIENADVDIFYWRLISQFWSLKGGVNYFYRPAEKAYWQPGIGIEGLMPYFIGTNARLYYHRGSTKLDLELDRDTQITNNFFIKTSIRSILATKTVLLDEVGKGLNQMRYTLRPYYRLMPGLNIFIEYEYEQYYGKFRVIQREAGESTHENRVTLGLSVLF